MINIYDAIIGDNNIVDSEQVLVNNNLDFSYEQEQFLFIRNDIKSYLRDDIIDGIITRKNNRNMNESEYNYKLKEIMRDFRDITSLKLKKHSPEEYKEFEDKLYYDLIKIKGDVHPEIYSCLENFVKMHSIEEKLFQKLHEFTEETLKYSSNRNPVNSYANTEENLRGNNEANPTGNVEEDKKSIVINDNSKKNILNYIQQELKSTIQILHVMDSFANDEFSNNPIGSIENIQKVIENDFADYRKNNRIISNKFEEYRNEKDVDFTDFLNRLVIYNNDIIDNNNDIITCIKNRSIFEKIDNINDEGQMLLNHLSSMIKKSNSARNLSMNLEDKKIEEGMEIVYNERDIIKERAEIVLNELEPGKTFKKDDIINNLLIKSRDIGGIDKKWFKGFYERVIDREIRRQNAIKQKLDNLLFENYTNLFYGQINKLTTSNKITTNKPTTSDKITTNNSFNGNDTNISYSTEHSIDTSRHVETSEENTNKKTKFCCSGCIVM